MEDFYPTWLISRVSTFENNGLNLAYGFASLGQRYYNCQVRSFKFPSEEKIKAGADEIDFLEKKTSKYRTHVQLTLDSNLNPVTIIRQPQL